MRGNEFAHLPTRELRRMIKEKYKKIEHIDKLYKNSISDRLYAQLELIYKLKSCINFDIINALKLDSFEEILFRDPIEPLIDKLENIYNQVVTNEGDPVWFESHYSVICFGPPIIINLSLLVKIISGSTSSINYAYFESADWTEVTQKLLPFMQKYSLEFKKLIEELQSLEDEDNYRSDCREGEAHVKWLLTEFGEDVFSDRD